MNFIDVILILILLLSAWRGFQKGFILGLADLFCWLGGLVATFLLYPFILKYLPLAGAWTVFLTFILTLIAIRLVLAFVANQALKQVPAPMHLSPTNKTLGLFPGFISGLIYASIAAALLLLLPISTALTNETRDSTLATKLSERLETLESRLGPVLDDVNRSLSKITIEPSSDKFIKLGFSVKDARRRPDLEKEMLDMVNKERRKAGLKALKADPEIAQVALKHSADMFSRGYFSHISPEGATPFDRIQAAGVSFLTAGENLALAQTLTLAHTGLMDSPGHRANILHQSFGRLGIGILDGGIHGIMVTQNFRN
ncbi:CvpA family protein [Paradesertivirga mongoliensis]|uniref:CvpA family protein n=1 Tax=Paradesertivirga mongoliensis TaxID=2100740 RepID=A0ABW4ZK65_9SPHI|nr:CvpA family protein [Pedobacter mongoliensis]